MRGLLLWSIGPAFIGRTAVRDADELTAKVRKCFGLEAGGQGVKLEQGHCQIGVEFFEEQAGGVREQVDLLARSEVREHLVQRR